MSECVFCEIVAGRAEGNVPTRWDDAIALAPLRPVTEGHMLILPREHVRDAMDNQWTTAATVRRAVQFWRDWLGETGPCNLIMSVGAEATQTIEHLHIHVLPRRPGDGLMLPWSNQHATEEAQ